MVYFVKSDSVKMRHKNTDADAAARAFFPPANAFHFFHFLSYFRFRVFISLW